ncbi:MAG: TIGR04282 family arsenosugar biosynthesis glycosyltransferase [Planctomycetales bacterium]|nr:TIGR04282 family arsenosugar biosynthesis glycosyltransferase [Planctomycetales bacterium]
MNRRFDRQSDSSLHLGVMAKYWEPGKVKTRLGASVGMDQSAQLHLAFCHHLAKSLVGAADRRSFVITPVQRKPDFQHMLPAGWDVEFQSAGDLGDRMRTWFQALPSHNRVLIGADCPELDDGVIRRAGEMLIDHDVVLGPALDGGYCLIALRAGWRPEYEVLFDDVHWSSDTVLATTINRIHSVGLRHAMLEPREDIDTIDELDRLRERLKSSLSGSQNQVLLGSIDRILARKVDS